MGVAVIGAVIVVLTVAIRLSTVRAVRRQGRSVSTWRYLMRSPTLWVGIIVMVSAISLEAATVLAVLCFGAFVVTFGRQLRTEHTAKKVAT